MKYILEFHRPNFTAILGEYDIEDKALSKIFEDFKAQTGRDKVPVTATFDTSQDTFGTKTITINFEIDANGNPEYYLILKKAEPKTMSDYAELAAEMSQQDFLRSLNK